MRSELKENNLDASLSRGVWWEDHLGLEIWRVALIGFGNDLLLLFIIYMPFHIIVYSMF